MLCSCAAAPPAARVPQPAPLLVAAATVIPAPAPAVAPSEATPATKPFRDCGPLACKAFPSAAAAFDFVLAEAPRVLAVGEAHAQSDGPKSASSTRRFTEILLPRLSPRASDLVIELWLANGSCGKVERKVAEQQAAVTAPQAGTNQNEFLELGDRAKGLGIMPHALIPSCDQYQKISAAGPSDIEEMLVMIKNVTQRDVEQLLAKRAPERLVVAYGGAMHNDLAPRAGREDFSFGPALSAATAGRYTELDLVIPEQVKDSEAWRALPWFSHYSREQAGSEAYLYSWAPHAYALLFPPSKTAEKAP